MHSWQPSKYLQDPQEYRQKHVSETTGQGKFALIVLNQPILIQRHLFENVWNNATYKFCADGGANRLYDLLGTDDERAKYLPDYIRGDLDSLRDSVKEYYVSKNVPVERVDDVVTTDFMKCVELVRVRDQQLDPAISSTISTGSPKQLIQEQQERLTTPLGIVALGGTGGRFDQSMSSIHYLYILNQERQATLISDESVIIVLETGKHEITCNLDIEGPTCGIIPVGSSEAMLTTTGLKWDVENWKSSFGTQISTSNALTGSRVTIETNAPVVWTTELKSG
ncbi:MAG: thiamine pyrophosphokinase [Benniella sp.]|nr:MAG: thiamine pyrophosphokinase [Benniella sp.]